MTVLNRGQIVAVYEDPLTREELEGKARLIREISHGEGEETPDRERWVVQFLEDKGSEPEVEREFRTDLPLQIFEEPFEWALSTAQMARRTTRQVFFLQKNEFWKDHYNEGENFSGEAKVTIDVHQDGGVDVLVEEGVTPETNRFPLSKFYFL